MNDLLIDGYKSETIFNELMNILTRTLQKTKPLKLDGIYTTNRTVLPVIKKRNLLALNSGIVPNMPTQKQSLSPESMRMLNYIKRKHDFISKHPRVIKQLNKFNQQRKSVITNALKEIEENLKEETTIEVKEEQTTNTYDPTPNKGTDPVNMVKTALATQLLKILPVSDDLRKSQIYEEFIKKYDHGELFDIAEAFNNLPTLLDAWEKQNQDNKPNSLTLSNFYMKGIEYKEFQVILTDKKFKLDRNGIQITREYRLQYYEIDKKLQTRINTMHPTIVMEVNNIRLFDRMDRIKQRKKINHKVYKSNLIPNIRTSWNNRLMNQIEIGETYKLGDFRLRKSMSNNLTTGVISAANKILKTNNPWTYDYFIEKLSKLLTIHLLKNNIEDTIWEYKQQDEKYVQVQFIQIPATNNRLNLTVNNLVPLGDSLLVTGPTKKGQLEIIKFCTISELPTFDVQVVNPLIGFQLIPRFLYSYEAVLPRQITIYTDNINEAKQIWESIDKDYFYDNKNVTSILQTLADTIGNQETQDMLKDLIICNIIETQTMCAVDQEELSYVPFSFPYGIGILEYVPNVDQKAINYDYFNSKELLNEAFNKTLMVNTIISEGYKNSLQTNTPLAALNDLQHLINAKRNTDRILETIFINQNSIFNQTLEFVGLKNYLDYSYINGFHTGDYSRVFEVNVIKEGRISLPICNVKMPTTNYIHIMNKEKYINNTLSEILNAAKTVSCKYEDGRQGFESTMGASFGLNFLRNVNNGTFNTDGKHFLVYNKHKQGVYAAVNSTSVEATIGNSYYVDMQTVRSSYLESQTSRNETSLNIAPTVLTKNILKKNKGNNKLTTKKEDVIKQITVPYVNTTSDKNIFTKENKIVIPPYDLNTDPKGLALLNKYSHLKGISSNIDEQFNPATGPDDYFPQMDFSYLSKLPSTKENDLLWRQKKYNGITMPGSYEQINTIQNYKADTKYEEKEIINRFKETHLIKMQEWYLRRKDVYKDNTDVIPYYIEKYIRNQLEEDIIWLLHHKFKIPAEQIPCAYELITIEMAVYWKIIEPYLEENFNIDQQRVIHNKNEFDYLRDDYIFQLEGRIEYVKNIVYVEFITQEYLKITFGLDFFESIMQKDFELELDNMDSDYYIRDYMNSSYDDIDDELI